MTGKHHPELETFAQAVAARLGLGFHPHNEDQMDETLRRRLERTGCRTVTAYLDRFKNLSFAQQELRAIAEELTVAETFFFRHPEHFSALVEVALPQRLKARDLIRQINVLSAGCAGGEEAYSLAAAIMQVPGLQNWKVVIQGVDVNPQLMDKACQGRYSAWSLRAVSELDRRRYFTRADKEFVLDDALKSMVCFEERNLLDDDPAFWKPDFYDIIFCRNVMIYFSPAAVRTLAARFTAALAPGGFLFLGPSETLRGISREYHLRHTHGAFYYQKRLPHETASLLPPTPSATQMLTLEAAAGTLPTRDPAWVSAIADASRRISAIQDRPSRQAEEQAARRPAAAKPGAAFPSVQDLEEVRDLFRQERFEDALQAIKELPQEAAADPDTLLLEAVMLANQGEIRRAEEACALLLKRDELRPGAHYLMAVCREKSGDHLAAAEHDQAAIYLDEGFAMPHLHLGLLAKRLGDQPTARRELAEALALLGREDAARILLFGGGFSREALVRFCQAQMARCGENR